MSRSHERVDLFECPHCGADVPVGAKVCKECGSDAGTGWQSSEEVEYQSLDLPEGYAANEAHPGGPVSTATKRWVIVTALVVAIVLVLRWTGVLAFF